MEEEESQSRPRMPPGQVGLAAVAGGSARGKDQVVQELRRMLDQRMAECTEEFLASAVGMRGTVRRFYDVIGNDAENLRWVDLCDYQEFFARSVACCASYQVLLQIPRDGRGESSFPWMEYTNYRFPGWEELNVSQMVSLFSPCKLYYYLLVFSNDGTLQQDFVKNRGDLYIVELTSQEDERNVDDDSVWDERSRFGSADLPLLRPQVQQHFDPRTGLRYSDADQFAPDDYAATDSDFYSAASELVTDILESQSLPLPPEGQYDDEFALANDFSNLSLTDIQNLVELETAVSLSDVEQAMDVFSRFGEEEDDTDDDWMHLCNSANGGAMHQPKELQGYQVPSLFSIAVDKMIELKLEVNDIADQVVDEIIRRFVELVDLAALNMSDWPRCTMEALVCRAHPNLLYMIPHENRAMDSLPWDTFCGLRFGSDYKSSLNPAAARVLSPCRLFFLLLQRELQEDIDYQ